MDDPLAPTADPAWLLHAAGYDPLRETSAESRFAISNGFLGVRAARGVTRGLRAVAPPRTWVAGLFGTPGDEPASPILVPAADWLRVRILLPGGPLVHHPGDVDSYRMSLDMKRGALLSAFHRSKPPEAKDPDLGIRGRTLRLVSLAERAIGLQLLQFEIEAGETEVILEASFEGLDIGLVAERLGDETGLWRTHRTGRRLAMATSASLQVDGRELAPTRVGELKFSWTWTSRPAQRVCFERFVAVVRSDSPDRDPSEDAIRARDGAIRLGWRGVMAAHEAAWTDRWRLADVEVEGDDAAQQALRFAVYHLNGAANPADERVSIGARALTGEDYHGHVFWDTEIYLLPFFVTTWPAAARSMLMYRFRTLDGARAKAAGMGWRGALYAWESADSGAETTPEHAIGPDRRVTDILCGKQEQHISADVAYAVWHYWLATGDEAFLLDAGAEILLETARFWSSRIRLEADGFGHIRGVIGPDEYHEHVDDNAFTNVMARWNIRRALETATLLRKRWPARWASLSAGLKLADDELAQWARAAETIATGLDPATGLFEQFAGFNQLEEIDLSKYSGRSVPMDVVLGRERIARSQVVKQADVVALLGLLPEEFPREMAARNFGHYEPRCSHGSSLSRAMHGFVAARLGRSDMALRYCRETAAIDLGDARITSDGGVHIAALGGVWMTAVLGFAGLSFTPDGPVLDPRLPPDWRSLAFRFQWRGRSVGIRIAQDGGIEAKLEAGDPMPLVVGGRSHKLGAGDTRIVSISGQRPPPSTPIEPAPGVRPAA
ncbi:MAG: glycosyl hydrolase family 65 protein [Roseiarcus sp.]|jgi:trehalose/maltose hydrolase-like predicted phosphorylase